MARGKHSTLWPIGATVTTAMCMALVLLLVTAMAATTLVASKLTRQVQESAGLNLSIANNVMPDQLDSLNSLIAAMPFAAHTHVVTRSEALQQWKDETGEDLVVILGENPLNASIEVNVKTQWSSNDSLVSIKQGLEQMPGVIDVATSTRQVDNIMNNAQHLLTVIAVSAALLLIIAIVLITSLVRLQTYSQRFHIHTMTLVGANTWFIVRPYMLRGAIMGLVAGVLAGGVVIMTWRGLAASHDPFYHALVTCLAPHDVVTVVTLTTLLGVIVSAIAAALAAKHYTRASHDELYA
ncbi:MAG: permease-like cell division protein FtsX [Bacteroidales bacterium]|nr:permease-like cell division protein FtsX [Candidatus Sodaliphilus fimicaballi]